VVSASRGTKQSDQPADAKPLFAMRSSVVFADLRVFSFICLFGWSANEPTVLLPLTGLIYQLWMIDDDDCGAEGGTKDLQG
jgi:hypothetical protein